jgi:hypothetical protein
MNDKEFKADADLYQLFSAAFIENVMKYITETLDQVTFPFVNLILQDKLITRNKKFMLSKQWIKHKTIQEMFVEMHERTLAFARKQFSENKDYISQFLTNFHQDRLSTRGITMHPRKYDTKEFFTRRKQVSTDTKSNTFITVPNSKEKSLQPPEK